MIKVNDNLNRDGHSKALLSSNRKALQEHRQRLKQVDDINSLREDVSELKNIVLELIKKVDK